MGLDSPSTIQEYITLAHYCFATAQVPASLKLLYRARYLLKLIHGENHPEMATIDQNIGLVLFFSAQFDYAQAFFENALKLHVQYQVKKVGTIFRLVQLMNTEYSQLKQLLAII